jgi:hypothetical protein
MLRSIVQLKMTQEHLATGAHLAHLANATITHFPQMQWLQQHHSMAENKSCTLFPEMLVSKYL